MLLLEPGGVMKQVLEALNGREGYDFKWLADSVMVQFSTILVYFWKYIGYFTILYITGIGKIPNTVYDAATIDGASSWQRFRFITIQLLKPTTAMVSIMAMIQCLKIFSTPYLLSSSVVPLAPINFITFNI